jgi:gliding motility-associated-like protein
MKKVVLFFVIVIAGLFVAPYSALAQNLVINPSFETITACPAGPGELDKAAPWRDPYLNLVGDTCSSSDLYNVCSPLGGFGVGVPANILGNEPANTGSGYAGIILYEGFALTGCQSLFGSGWREYVEGTLTTPLVAGETYCVSFYISLADNVKFATRHIGVYFSPTLVDINCATVGAASHLPFTPQLVYGGPEITITNGWQRLQWDYTAAGGEQYIIIGNFNDDAGTTYICANEPAFNPYAYYYIDDVSVIEDPCCLADVDPVPPLCIDAAPVVLVPLTSGGTWSGPGISNPASGVFDPALAGTGSHTIYHTLSCGTDSVIIVVSSCATLEVCSNSDGTWTASNGTGTYTWEQFTSTQDCSGCFVGCEFPPGCAVNSSGWTTIGTGATIPAPTIFPVRVVDDAGGILEIPDAAAIQPCTECPTITVVITDQTDVSCPGGNDGSATVLGSGGNGPYTYTWSPGSLTGDNQTTLGATAYTVTATDADNCTGNVVVTIGEPANGIAVSITSVTDASCAGNDGAASAEVVNGVEPITYLWSPSGGANADATGLAPGNYTVTVTDANGCSAEASTTVGSSGGPVIDAVDTEPTGCAPPSGSITITATGTGLEYSIDGGATYQADNTFNGLAVGTYDVAVRDADGCVAVSTATITSNAGPVIVDITSTASGCNASTGSITVNATGTGLQYSIDGGTTFQVDNTFTGLGAGLYIITVSDADGCITSGQGSVGTLSGPSIAQVNSTDPSCGLADGTVTVLATGTDLEYSIDGGTTFQASNVFTGLAPGSYDVAVSAQGCLVFATAVLVDGTGPTIAGVVPVQPLCTGDANGTLTVQANGNGPFQYSIDGGTTFVATPQFTGLPAGSYDFLVRDAGGCETTGSAVLSDPAALQVSVEATAPSCAGDCSGVAVATVTGGTVGTGYQFSWTSGTGVPGSPTATGICAGDHSVIVNDANGCSASADFTLAAPVPFTIDSVATTAESCPDACDGIMFVNAPTGVSFQIGTGTPQALPVFTGLCPGTYVITVADADGCTATASGSIGAGAPISAGFTTNPTVASVLVPRFLFTNSSTNAVSYSWDFGIYGTSTSTDPTLVLPEQATEFTACLTATNSAGCSDTECMSLVVLADFAVYVPNTFTPDNDGINDVFYVMGDPSLNKNFRLDIFNRWGEEIFTSTDILQGWDGTYKGTRVMDGVYPWRVSVQDPNTAEIYKLTGHVTVLR